MAVSRETLDRFYVRVIGFMYQVLGDAELAARATESVFVRRESPIDELAVWKAALDIVRSYVARGFVVRPLVPETHGRQAALLRGLARVPPLERAVLLLRYHEELSIEQLATLMAIDERAVRTEIARTRARLLDELDAPW